MRFHLEESGSMTAAEAGPPVDLGARESILKVAAALFARKGYAATTVREIVEAAGDIFDIFEIFIELPIR